MRANFSAETMEARRKWQNIFQVLNEKKCQDFPGGTVVEGPPANAGDTRLIPGLGRS